MPPFFNAHGDPNMDPFTILSLPHTATEAEIKKAYRMQMLQLHPDKLSPILGDHSIADVTEKFHNVKDAYEFLVSPMYLTARRLYMTKMASRRAEYERREAFVRRQAGSMGDGYTAYVSRGTGVSGYSRGGGGAAGMAGTGNCNNLDPSTGGSSGMRWSKSEPNFCKQKDHRYKGRAGNGVNNNSAGARMHRNTKVHAADRGKMNGNTSHYSNAQQRPRASNRRDNTFNRGRQRNGGYKSDSAGHTKSKSNIREGRSHKPGAKGKASRNDSKQTRRQRTKSEPRYRHNNREKLYESSEGEKNNNRDHLQKSRHRDNVQKSRHQDVTTTRDHQKREQRRSRAKSAPARCRSGRNKQNNPTTSHNNKKDNTNKSNVPKHFFCPLTKKLMKDPVVDSEGNTYEREAIERWLRSHNSSPITNEYLSVEMLHPDKELKRAIYKATGKPRSKSQGRTKSARSSSPNKELNSGRVLIDSYLREISSKSKLSISLDCMGICAFSYRRITFVIEVPITAHAGFMVYSSFDGKTKNKLSEKMFAWNTWLRNIGRYSRVSYVKAGKKTVFTLKGGEEDMAKCDVFQKSLEYFVEMSLKLHNLLHPLEAKAVENVCLTRVPVVVAR